LTVRTPHGIAILRRLAEFGQADLNAARPQFDAVLQKDHGAINVIARCISTV